MLFDKPSTQVSPAREHDILAFWAKERIFWESMKIRENGPRFVFFEGPPTANGTPHPGHVLTKAMKDVVPRYKTMCGFHVGRKAGWDTHGLPVEIEVEKQLGIEGKQGIETYGVEKFIKKCRESVFKYEKEWRAMVERGGFWIDNDDPYITCTNEYIETVWWMLGRFWHEGLLYEGHKVVPYCPRCGTALSSHEVAQGYDEAEDPSVFVRFRLKGKPDTSFLVWTTTPWTLLSNVALAVGPDVEYVKVKVDGEYLIFAKARWEVLKGKGEIVESCRGIDLRGTEYEPLFTFAKADKKAHYVITGDFVSTEDGTGIVHIAPAFGEDDYRVGKENDLPVLQPVDLAGRFTDEVTPWKGRFVKDADPDIIAHLKQTGHLLYATTIKHTYPFCWRCDSPLLYYARHSWFIRTTAFKEQVLANNEKINWFPAHVKEGRFRNFLENMVDWAISRDRYWGTPLPIWKCRCGHHHLVDSIADLRRRAKSCPPDLELHKPYVDQIELTCEKCQGTMKRVPEVIDCWFDSGAMHTAQWHYPFENKEVFERNFPADFICEAIDQTRGWFYSLLVTSTFIHKAPAYKNVVVLGLICDKNGIKMSKSKGNVLDCMALFEKYGADAVRWALYSGTAPWNTRRFYEEGIAEAQSRFLGTLQNVYSFFVLYANLDSFNPRQHSLAPEQRSELDRWILSRYHRTIGEVRAAMDIFEITRATQALETLVDELSNWYVRRSRRRFWASGASTDKTAAFLTLYEVLTGIAKLAAPFTPFLTEDIWRNLVSRLDPQAPRSVHLADYPVVDEARLDPDLEKRMAFVMRVVSLGRAARNEANLKVRQPLSTMKILVQNDSERQTLEAMRDLIMDELNVKAIEPITEAGSLTRFVVKPNFRTIGQGPYKALIPKIKAHLETADGNAVQRALASGRYVFTIDGTEVALTANEVEVSSQASSDWIVQSEGGLTVALHKVLTRPLILEGLARELVNKIQNMRKEAGLEIADRIALGYRVEDAARQGDIAETLAVHGDYIKQETLARRLDPLTDPQAGTEWNINGIKVRLAITKEEGK
ncbi:MAG: Isoleucyl-tRNA synthetase [Candidatus Ozemobacter sibiricus]|jgi:isoleucyl-tRNA synthetase|uniref:Isoleucine--tRNA ligase n=1 Tax=Candidatus Ozemobacter sibiricus TaxID=2268124 RepID=A0A367ZL63_9BACT|nr:MAG: Isoleucyl-tRNA synthetase [Candidatus Ozemobacter sibiricus]